MEINEYYMLNKYTIVIQWIFDSKNDYINMSEANE